MPKLRLTLSVERTIRLSLLMQVFPLSGPVHRVVSTLRRLGPICRLLTVCRLNARALTSPLISLVL